MTFARSSGAAPDVADQLDAEATALMQAHRYAEACPKLAESDRQKPGTGVLMRLALCYELSGRTASAWSSYREASTRARRTGDATLADLASRRAAGLEPRLARLVIRLPADVDAAQVDVRLDGEPFAPSSLGVDVPVDPGTHAVHATAGGRRAFDTSFSVEAHGGTTAVAVELPPLARETGVAATGGEGAPLRTVALVTGSVGLACIAAGSILGLAAMSNWNHARSECKSGNSGCSQDALDLQSTINAETLASTITFTVGGVALAAAGLLWFIAPSPHGGGVSVSGSL
jgi:serine/threonine-protein kinase